MLRKQVLSVLTLLAVPAWDSLLTEREISQIEIVLKTGLRIICGQNYISFSSALIQVKMITMKEQRKNIVDKFVKKCLKNEKFSKWFVFDQKTINTRQKCNLYKTVPACTSAFDRSPIPVMTRIANNLKTLKYLLNHT